MTQKIRVWLDVYVKNPEVIQAEAEMLTNDEVTSLKDATMRVVRSRARDIIGTELEDAYEIEEGGIVDGVIARIPR